MFVWSFHVGLARLILLNLKVFPLALIMFYKCDFKLRFVKYLVRIVFFGYVIRLGCCNFI